MAILNGWLQEQKHRLKSSAAHIKLEEVVKNADDDVAAEDDSEAVEPDAADGGLNLASNASAEVVAAGGSEEASNPSADTAEPHAADGRLEVVRPSSSPAAIAEPDAADGGLEEAERERQAELPPVAL